MPELMEAVAGLIPWVMIGTVVYFVYFAMLHHGEED